MRKFMATMVHILHLRFVKYGLAIAIGIVLVGVVGENSLMALFHNKLHITELNEEIEKYNQRTEDAMRQIKELDHNAKATERIARERYFMKQDDEDIFVLSDDDRTPQIMTSYNETAQ